MPLPVAGGPLFRRAISNRRRMDPSFLPHYGKRKAPRDGGEGGASLDGVEEHSDQMPVRDTKRLSQS
jgi:hypothetical protein